MSLSVREVMCYSFLWDLGTFFIYGDLVLKSQWVELTMFELCYAIFGDGKCISEGYVLFD